jgi:hypothetical protein
MSTLVGVLDLGRAVVGDGQEVGAREEEQAMIRLLQVRHS